jgi:hypothetical protein
LEGQITAVNIFDSILTNKNKGRENEAPAERFCAAAMHPLLVDVKWRPDKAPQERRSPISGCSHIAKDV